MFSCGVLPGSKQVDAIICRERPVVVLTGTIHTCEWLLMKQTL